MPLWLFELLCLCVIGLTLTVEARRRPLRELVRDYLSLAMAGWIGEQTCIALYHHYTYASGWHGRLGDVPVLVPLIWPLVILSARDVARCLAPEGTGARCLVVALVVFVDASMVEVLAVRAELWSWAEPGHLGVPLIGILGWAFFAGCADLALSWRSRWRHLALLVLVPLAAHALILSSWWGGLRWTLRGALEPGSLIAAAIFSAALTGTALALRRRGIGIELKVAWPRMIAASLFFALLLTTAAREASLWAHVVAVALPYFAATRFGASSRPSAHC